MTPAEASAVERRYPLIDLGLPAVQRLLEPLAGSPVPHTLELLEGGHINTNYLVGLADGRRLVLRLCPQREEVFRREIAVLRAIAGTVPVPTVHLALCEPRLFQHPYAVLEWIDGIPLDEALRSRTESAAEIGKAVASTLLKLAKHAMPLGRHPPFPEYIRQCLFERGASKWLGRDTTGRLWQLVQDRSSLFDPPLHSEDLVHGDFQGDNILLEESAEAWRVVAVLDWEWAHRGCFFEDLGSLTRFDGPAAAEFHSGLEAGCARQNATLPSNWLRLVRLWDIVAHCEKLTWPSHRGRVTLRSVQLIERCLREYAVE